MDNNTMLGQILEFNKDFVDKKQYLEYQTTGVPDKKMVILSCMDTRLTELLPQAMNIKNGDAKMIKNAGGSIVHPFGSAMRSILVSIFEFDVQEVFIVAHDFCGMCNLNTEDIIEKMHRKGITDETLNFLQNSGINVKHWLQGFSSIEDSLSESVSIVRNHPLLPRSVVVHGLIIDPHTGALRTHINGYENIPHLPND